MLCTANRLLVVLPLVALLAGCGDTGGALAEATTASEPAPREQPAPSATPPAAQASPQQASTEGAAEAGDWPRFRGPGGKGLAPAAKLPAVWSETENLLWKTPLPGAGGSSPVVWGQHIFLTCYTGYGVDGESGGDMNRLRRQVLCLDRDSGAIRWQEEMPTELPETDYDARVHNHGYASSTPLVDAERVYCFLGKSGVVALDHSGRQLWRTSVGGEFHGWGSGASPILFNDLLIVNAFVECGQLVALNKDTGQQVWRAGELKESWNTPLLVTLADGRQELVVAIWGSILGFDPATGEQLWSCKSHDWYIVGSMVAHEGVVYCMSGKGVESTCAVRAGGRGDVTDTHVLWTTPKGSNVSSLLLHDGHIYFAHDQQAVAYCLNAATGEIVYETRLPRFGEVYASPVIAGDKLIYLSRQGDAAVLDAAPIYNLLSHNRFESDRSRFNASPAVTGNRLLLRSDRFLYCIGAK